VTYLKRRYLGTPISIPYEKMLIKTDSVTGKSFDEDKINLDPTSDFDRLFFVHFVFSDF
jgi:hypothetical protein